MIIIIGILVNLIPINFSFLGLIAIANSTFTASSSIIAVQIHKLNSEKADTTASNAENSIANIETSDNPRATKDKTKRIATTANVDESVTTPSKVTDEGVKTANNETNEDDTAAIVTEIEAQVAIQVTQEVGVRSITAGGENNVQSVGAATEAALPSSSKKWRHVTADCLACVRTRPPSSHELREAFFAGRHVILVEKIRE